MATFRRVVDSNHSTLRFNTVESGSTGDGILATYYFDVFEANIVGAANALPAGVTRIRVEFVNEAGTSVGSLSFSASGTVAANSEFTEVQTASSRGIRFVDTDLVITGMTADSDYAFAGINLIYVGGAQSGNLLRGIDAAETMRIHHNANTTTFSMFFNTAANAAAHYAAIDNPAIYAKDHLYVDEIEIRNDLTTFQTGPVAGLHNAGNLAAEQPNHTGGSTEIQFHTVHAAPPQYGGHVNGNPSEAAFGDNVTVAFNAIVYRGALGEILLDDEDPFTPPYRRPATITSDPRVKPLRVAGPRSTPPWIRPNTEKSTRGI